MTRGTQFYGGINQTTIYLSYLYPILPSFDPTWELGIWNVFNAPCTVYCAPHHDPYTKNTKRESHVSNPHIHTHYTESSLFFMTNPNPIDDDQFYADDGFGDYIPTTIDPGPWMLGGVCLYSLICFLLLPIFVFVAKNRRRRRQNKLDAMIADSAIEKAKRDSTRKEKEGKDVRDDNMNVVDLSRESNLK